MNRKPLDDVLEKIGETYRDHIQNGARNYRGKAGKLGNERRDAAQEFAGGSGDQFPAEKYLGAGQSGEADQ